MTLMKLMGTEVVVKFAELASMVSLAPAAVFVAWGFITVPMKPERWFEGLSSADSEQNSSSWSSSGAGANSNHIHWELLISWMLWLNSGMKMPSHSIG